MLDEGLSVGSAEATCTCESINFRYTVIGTRGPPVTRTDLPARFEVSKEVGISTRKFRYSGIDMVRGMAPALASNVPG